MSPLGSCPPLVLLDPSAGVVEAVIDVWRAIGKRSEMLVYGRSMEPSIPKGSRVVVDHRLAELAVGDVIVFKNVDHLTMHRVIEMRRDGDGVMTLVTRGDGNFDNDEPIGEHAVLGKVITIKMPGGKGTAGETGGS